MKRFCGVWVAVVVVLVLAAPALGGFCCQKCVDSALTNDVGQCQEDGHDQRAGAAHAGGLRQVAGQREVGPAAGVGKITRHPPSRGHRVVGPVAPLRRDRRFQRKGSPITCHCVDNCDAIVLPRCGNQAKPPLRGGDHASAARIVGMLAEDLDSAGDEKRPAPCPVLGRSQLRMGRTGRRRRTGRQHRRRGAG